MEPNVAPDYAAPSPPLSGEELPPRRAFDWLSIILQIGHRCVSLAVFVVILALAAGKYVEARPLARVAFILADVACVCGVGGWYFAVVRRKPMREAIGLLVFSLLIAGASLMALLR